MRTIGREQGRISGGQTPRQEQQLQLKRRKEVQAEIREANLRRKEQSGFDLSPSERKFMTGRQKSLAAEASQLERLEIQADLKKTSETKNKKRRKGRVTEGVVRDWIDLGGGAKRANAAGSPALTNLSDGGHASFHYQRYL